jgi:hypothetical protein
MASPMGCTQKVFVFVNSSHYYKPKENNPDDFSLLKRIEELVEEFHRYGYRRITAQLHRKRIPVNHNLAFKSLSGIFSMTAGLTHLWFSSSATFLFSPFFHGF